LRIEALETRSVPAAITPTMFADGGLGSGSLRDAVLQFNVDAGTDDDIIQLLAGTYTLSIRNAGGHHETAGLTGDLNLNQTSHRWIIHGAGPSTIIDASQLQDRTFQIVNPGTRVVFQDLVIQGGLAQDDGSDGALAGTTDALGGGILNNGGEVTLDNVVVQNNQAQGGEVTALSTPGHNARGGGIYSSGGALTLAGAMLANNHVVGGGGGDHNGVENAGDGGQAAGGGLYATGGTLDISDSIISSNRATGGRGGDGSFSESSFHNGGKGGSGLGGGLYVNGRSLTIATSTIASNQGTGGSGGLDGPPGSGQGGGLYNGGTLTVMGCTLSGNSASHGVDFQSGGGGISNVGTLTVTGSTLSGNSATPYNYAGGGGGISNAGRLTVSNSTLSGNSAGGGFGGGIYNSLVPAVLTVTGSTLSGNTAGIGGGISNYFGTLTVTDSTLSGNSAGAGGGIYNYLSTVTVTDSTLSGNSARHSGGGIENDNGTLTVSNSTLTANRANIGNDSFHGGGVFVNRGPGATVLHNTLIAGNFTGATRSKTRNDVYGALDPGGDYNLIGDGTGMTGLTNGVNGNLIGNASDPIDPLLDSLGDYGGSTKTHALLAGSPALNAGNPNQMGATDQRGVVRRGGVNIGAYQASASAFLVSAPDTVQSGVPFDVIVTAVDPFRQLAVGYTGTVTFRSSDPDPGVVLPADYPFTLADGGVHRFTNTGRGETTLVTPGDQTLTVTDTTDNTITGNAIITVNSPSPEPGPRGHGPRPNTLPPTPTQAQLSTRSEASVNELVAAEGWFALFHDMDYPWLTAPRSRHQAADPTDAWLTDPFDREGAPVLDAGG
jgi:hypothetical protein